jgi:hypothetical protein
MASAPAAIGLTLCDYVIVEQGLRSTDRLYSSRPVDLVKGAVV